MDFFIRIAISLCVIITCVTVGKRLPYLAGLIATMPLTGLIVLVWLYTENTDNYLLLFKYTKGALWGIIPSILFFITASTLLKKQVPFFKVIIISFAIWFIGAIFHQLLLKT